MKAEYKIPDPDRLLETLQANYFEELKQAKRTEGKLARAEACGAVKQRAAAAVIPDANAADAVAPERFASAWHELESRVAGRTQDLRRANDELQAEMAKRITAEMDNISHRLTQRIKELSERYEFTLPQLAEEVVGLEEKVNSHVRQMNYLW